jgi:uncharacterized protein YqhQ
MDKKIHRTTIGGQALIEGIMMRGVDKASIAVRMPNGEIDIEIQQTSSIKDRFTFLKLPFIRGIVNFIEMMIFGYKSLMISAEKSGFDDISDENPSKFEKWLEKHSNGKIGNMIVWISGILGAAIAVGLFMVAPATAVSFLKTAFPDFFKVAVVKALIEGLIRITIFVIYLALVAQLKDIQRVYEYHGAEHKSIHCYEAGEELTVENIRKYSRWHPRCGTSFLLIVMVIGIIVFSFVTWSSIPVRVALKIVLLPVVVGIAYEIIRFMGRHDNNSFVRILSAPGMWLQSLTTKEPHDDQIEVAIKALEAVIPDNKELDKW